LIFLSNVNNSSLDVHGIYMVAILDADALEMSCLSSSTSRARMFVCARSHSPYLSQGGCSLVCNVGILPQIELLQVLVLLQSLFDMHIHIEYICVFKIVHE